MLIVLIQIIALVFLPVEPITSTTPWHEEKVEYIEQEPCIEEIEKELNRKRIRIMEWQPNE
jgi:hypothetical protein